MTPPGRSHPPAAWWGGRLLVGLLAGLLLRAAAGPSSLQAAPSASPARAKSTAPVESAEVTVRETSVLVEPPPRRGDFERTGNWWVFEDAVEREVVRAERVDPEREPEGQVLIWLAEDFAGALTRRRALVALTATMDLWLRPQGDVALALDGRVVAQRRGDPDYWRGRLGDAAGSAAVATSGDATPTVAVPAPASVAPRPIGFEATDALLAELVRRASGSDPRWLFLAVDRRHLVPEREARLRALLVPGPPGPVDAAEARDAPAGGATVDLEIEALANAGRLITSLGWIPVLLAIEPVEERKEPPREDEFDGWRQDVLGGAPACAFCLRTRKPGGSFSPAWLDAQLDLDFALWRTFVRPSAGRVVSGVGELEATLSTLSQRRRLWFRTETPRDGRERPLEVRWAPTGQVLRAPAWRRSSTPVDAAALALRQLFRARSREAAIDWALARRWRRTEPVAAPGGAWSTDSLGGARWAEAGVVGAVVARRPGGVRLTWAPVADAASATASPAPATAADAAVRLSCLAEGAPPGEAAHLLIAVPGRSGPSVARPFDLDCPGLAARGDVAVRLENLSTAQASEAILGPAAEN